MLPNSNCLARMYVVSVVEYMNSPVVEVDIRWLNIRHARIDLLFAIQPLRCDIEGIELGRIAMVMRHEVNDQ